jgi:hypothetical protein
MPVSVLRQHIYVGTQMAYRKFTSYEEYMIQCFECNFIIFISNFLIRYILYIYIYITFFSSFGWSLVCIELHGGEFFLS